MSRILTMLNLSIIPILLFLFMLNHVIAITSDGQSLLSFKSVVDGNAPALADWNDNDPTPCRWTGVTCANISGISDPQVAGIDLPGKNLQGVIPPEIGNLTYLRRLNLQNNNFHGPIPDQIFNPTSLHSIIISGNNLSGKLPATICNPSHLQTLDLSHNSLSGTIQKVLGNCYDLQRLILAGNKISGEIPAGIFSKLTNLIQLDLSSNSFSGSLPFDIGQLKSLSGTLNISFNQFTGKLPESLGDLPLTVSFDLRHNNFTGEIPQTGSFANQGPTAFLDNPSLCGPPLEKACRSVDSSETKSLSPVMDGNVSKKGLKPGMIVLISMGDAFGVSLVGLLFVYLYWRKKDSNGCSCVYKGRFGGNQEFKNIKKCSFPCISGFPGSDSEVESGKGDPSDGSEEKGELVAIDKGFRIELDELLRASAYVLGKSGLGIVYKVVLGNGVPVAVRRLGEGGEGRYKEFVTEVQAIGKVKHPNVVKLRAYYWTPDEKLVISDFISNGNLASALRGRTSTVLTWLMRVKIIKGTARGLAYLHECSPRKFVHGDVKPSNILLDNEHQPYISDFGLNRLISITGNDVSSSSGLMGGGGGLSYLKSTQTEKVNNYRAPEARGSSNQPTQKWDVYSFGVVLLELLTGKSPELSSPTTSTSTEIPDLVKWVRKAFEEETPLSDMVDPMLLQEVHAKKEVLAMFHLAIACTEQDPEIRPRMKAVSERLEKLKT